MAKNSSVKVARSKVFTTPAFRAVFPRLNKPHPEYNTYEITCDVLEHPEIEENIRKQIEAFLPEAMEKVGAKKKPTNDFVREGTVEKGERKGQEFRRIGFKMKATRKKEGKDVPQRPSLVDAKRQPMKGIVFGGSLVKVAYYLQYTITPTGTFMSVKLAGVQVIEYVGPTGELNVNSAFDEEDGYEAPQGSEDEDSMQTGTDDSDEDEDGTIKGGEDF